MGPSAYRLGSFRRLGPVLAFGIAMLLIVPTRNAPGLAEESHGLAGDGTGGAVVAGDGTGGVNASTDVANVACQRFIVPIYPSNTDEWDRAVASDMPPGSILILNQGGTRAGDDPFGEKGGPGFAPDPELRERVEEAQERGFVVLGYVRTGKSGSNAGPRRGREQTDREIADLNAWYGVDGIFYDEVWSDDRYFDYYAELVAHSRSVVPGPQVFNTGGSPSDSFAGLADIIGTFEGHADDFAAWSPRAWQLEYPATKWAAAVMSVGNAAEMRAVIWLSRTNHLGYIYVTDRFGTSTENPWTTLPPYWLEQVARLRQCNADFEPVDAG